MEFKKHTEAYIILQNLMVQPSSHVSKCTETTCRGHVVWFDDVFRCRLVQECHISQFCEKTHPQLCVSVAVNTTTSTLKTLWLCILNRSDVINHQFGKLVDEDCIHSFVNPCVFAHLVSACVFVFHRKVMILILFIVLYPFITPIQTVSSLCELRISIYF